MAGLVADLSMCEPQRRKPGRGVCLVANPITGLLGGSSVIAKPVCLHHQAELRPEEIDTEAVDVRLGEGRRESSPGDEAQKPPLKLGVGEGHRATVEKPTQDPDAWLGAVIFERCTQRVRIDVVVLCCLVDRGLELLLHQPWREIDQRADWLRDRDVVACREVVRLQLKAAVNLDTLPPQTGLGR